MASEGGGKGRAAQSLVGKVAIACAKQAYQLYKEIFADPRWQALADKGANTQRLLWASTGNKKPKYDALKYVENLIGPKTVNTVPLETMDIFKQQGQPADRLEQGLDHAREVLRGLPALALDLICFPFFLFFMNNPSKSPQYGGTQPAEAPLLDQAKQVFSQSGLTDLLDKLPESVKESASQATARFNKLSTTQKVIGGALLVLLVRRLTRGDKRHKKGRKHQAEASTLHELLHFVNDRVEGYKKAVEESQDPQRRGYYQQLVSQSQRFASELNDQLRRLGGGQETRTTLKGKLHRRFMAAAAVFTGHDEETVLASNIHGEQWATKAYEEALNDHALVGPARQLVERQYAQSQKTYQELKRMAG